MCKYYSINLDGLGIQIQIIYHVQVTLFMNNISDATCQNQALLAKMGLTMSYCIIQQECVFSFHLIYY